MEVIIMKYTAIGTSSRFPNHYIARADGQWYAVFCGNPSVAAPLAMCPNDYRPLAGSGIKMLRLCGWDIAEDAPVDNTER